jgi:hypothetical protein
MQQMSASERHIAYEIEIQIGEISETEWDQ